MSEVTNEYKSKVIEVFKKSGMAFTQKELDSIDYAEFGLNNIANEGLNLILYINNERYCAKEMVLLPNQACPEHMHPDFDDKKGKQETFRCRWGEVFLYIDDQTKLDSSKIQVEIPKGGNEQYYTAAKEIILKAGEQFTISPGIKHWFKAGSEGAVISEFSSPSYDEKDIFTNPGVKRVIRDEF